MYRYIDRWIRLVDSLGKEFLKVSLKSIDRSNSEIDIRHSYILCINRYTER